jgi:hypothetical protein
MKKKKTNIDRSDFEKFNFLLTHDGKVIIGEEHSECFGLDCGVLHCYDLQEAKIFQEAMQNAINKYIDLQKFKEKLNNG